MTAGKGELHGIIYHTVKAGNNQERIFTCDDDRREYLALLDRYKNRLRYRVYGYVLLPDHVHLLLAPGPVELSRIMHSLHSAYARYFNKHHGRSGHLFQSRYRAGPCVDIRHFWRLLRWLHLHPVRMGMAGGIDDFPWSSHGEYLAARPGAVADWGRILRTLAPDTITARRLYKDLMALDMEDEPRWLLEGWAEAAAAVSLDGAKGCTRGDTPTISTLVTETARATGTTVAKISSGDRSGPVVWARSLISYMGLRLGSWTAAEVARVVGKHPATIIRGADRLERVLNPEVEALIRRIWGRVNPGC